MLSTLLPNYRHKIGYLVDHVIDLAVGGVLPHASEDGCELLSGEDIIFKLVDHLSFGKSPSPFG